MENPIKVFREEHDLTQSRLAEYAGITRQVVTRLEAGLFADVPPSIIEVIKEYDRLGADYIIPLYKTWLDEEINKLSPTDVPPVGENYAPATFLEWRQDVNESVAGFCKMLKIQEVIISNYQVGKTQELPAVLKKRLRQIGWSQDEIEQLATLPLH